MDGGDGLVDGWTEWSTLVLLCVRTSGGPERTHKGRSRALHPVVARRHQRKSELHQTDRDSRPSLETVIPRRGIRWPTCVVSRSHSVALSLPVVVASTAARRLPLTRCSPPHQRPLYPPRLAHSLSRRCHTSPGEHSVHSQSQSLRAPPAAQAPQRRMFATGHASGRGPKF